jgi:hypothetical protein
MRKYDYYIGIDPGVKTGIVSWSRESNKFVQLELMMIHQAMKRLSELKENGCDFLVRFEDARQRNWFGNSGPERWKGAGSIMRDCGIWEAFLTDENIPFEMVPPKNNSTKLDAKKFKTITGYDGSTNEHTRDAAMLVFGL